MFAPLAVTHGFPLRRSLGKCPTFAVSDFLIILKQSLPFHFVLGSTNYVASPDWGPTSSVVSGYLPRGRGKGEIFLGYLSPWDAGES